MSDYAAKRGLPVEWLIRAGMDICPEDGERPGWLRIPYRHKTGSWGFRYRNLHSDASGEKYWNPSGQGTHLYNPSLHGPEATEVWFAEGEFDCVVLNELGFPSIGVPGVGHTDKLINSVWMRLYSGADLYIVFDGDKYGHEAGIKLRDGLDRRGIAATLVSVPEGHDVNSWYLEDEASLRDTLTRQRRQQ